MKTLVNISLVLFFCLWTATTVYGQYGATAYTAGNFPEHKDSTHVETNGPEDADSVEVPANDVYGGEWNTQHVRLVKQDLTKMKDSVYILFNKPDESHFKFPCTTDARLCSQFGIRGRRHFHAGVDLCLKYKDPIYAAFDGVVRIAKYYSGYGRMVVIRHNNGLETLYGHMTKINVKANQKVKAGDVIGLAGSTGRSTAVHLHFETRYLEQPFNPMHCIDFETHDIKKDTLLLTGNSIIVKSNRLPYEKTLVPDPPVETAQDSTATSEEPIVSLTVPVKETTLSRGAPTTVTPVKKVAVAKTSPANTSTANKSSGTVYKSGSKKYYVVRSGDTLYAIAKRNGTTIDAICKQNNLSRNAILPIGKKLIIP